MADPATENPDGGAVPEGGAAATQSNTGTTGGTEGAPKPENRPNGADSGATAASEAQDTEGGEAEAQSPPDWRASLEDEGLRKVAEKFTTPAAVLKSYAELEKRLGKSIVKPGKDASEEEVKAFHKALGVPDKPEDYKVEVPEGIEWGDDDKALMDSFLGKLHSAGAPPQAVEAATAWYFETLREAEEARTAEAERIRKEGEAALRKEWGGDYDKNLALANDAIRQFGGEQLAQTLKERGLDNDPAMNRAFAEIGRRMSEAAPLTGMSEDQKTTVQNRIDELASLKFTDPEKWRSKAIQEEWFKLHGQLGGNRPIVGASGRTA